MSEEGEVRSEEWRCGAQIKKRRKFLKRGRTDLLPHSQELGARSL